jgi:hypothetical protein
MAGEESAPLLILDLLATFYDENVPLVERCRLLQRCVYTLRRIVKRLPVAVWVQPRPSHAVEEAAFMKLLASLGEPRQALLDVPPIPR